MLSRFSVIGLAFLAVLAFNTSAAQASEVGIVNIQKIMQDSKAAQSLRAQLQSKQKSFQGELDTKQKQLVKEDQELVQQRGKMEKAAFEQKVKDFQNKAATAQREIQTKKNQLDKAFGEALSKIEKKIIAITQDVAKEAQMDVVIASSQVLYGDSKLDITDKVLSRLNSEMASVPVNF